MCGVLKFQARANAGQCVLIEGTQGVLSTAVGEALAEARERVILSHSLLKGGDGRNRVKPLYEQYFLTDLVRGDSLNEVLKRLVLTMNGLNGRIRLEAPEKIVGEVGVGAKQEAVGTVYDPRKLIKEVDVAKRMENDFFSEVLLNKTGSSRNRVGGFEAFFDSERVRTGVRCPQLAFSFESRGILAR